MSAPSAPGRVRASLRRVTGVALHAVLLATRSRVFLGMALVLVVVTIGLPATLRGDGSLAGTLQVMLDYTLGLSVLLIGVALLAVACGSIAREMEEGQLRLISVKPLHPAELWLGRWLGLTLLGCALLAVAGLGTYANVRWTVARAPGGEAVRQQAFDEVLTAQHALLPRAPDVAAEVDRRVAELLAAHPDLVAIPPTRLREVVQRRALSVQSAVAPGRSRTWHFVLPEKTVTGDATFRIRVAPGRDLTPVLAGGWRVVHGPEATLLWEGGLQRAEQAVGYLRLPPGGLKPGAELRVSYTASAHPGALSVVFDVDRGLELLLREGGFGLNLVRTLLVMGCRLSLLCALGLAAGTVFSFPVALFVSFALLLLALTGHFVVSTDATATALDAAAVSRPPSQVFSEALIRHVERVVAPAVAPSPRACLADGVLVSWAWVARSGLRVTAGLGGALALLAVLLLRHREIAAGAR